jgi:molybdopterin converting factor small subunit
MSIKIHLYSSLRKYTDNQRIVEVNGTTVGECLNDLVRQHPSILPLLFDETRKLLDKVFVSINLESTTRENLTTPVQETDDLYLILIVAGG